MPPGANRPFRPPRYATGEDDKLWAPEERELDAELWTEKKTFSPGEACSDSRDGSNVLMDFESFGYIFHVY